MQMSEVEKLSGFMKQVESSWDVNGMKEREYQEWGNRSKQGLIQLGPYWIGLMGSYWRV